MTLTSLDKCESPSNFGSAAQRLPSSISQRDLGLFAGTKPLGKRTRRGRTSSYHGVFGGHKALGLAIFESLLERDFQTVICADPRIDVYAIQPHRLNYWIPQPDGTQKAHTYTPDVCLRRRDSHPVVVVEVKHSSYVRMESWLQREPHIRRAYAEDHDVQFVVVTEREIRVQPRLSNFQTMLRYARPFDDVPADMAVRDALSRLADKPQIGQVCDMSSLCDGRVRRTYSALLRLALRGEITLDIDKPLSLSTVVLGGISCEQ